MTGKEMLKGIQNLDAGLIEEAEFAPYPKRKSFGKKKLLLLIAAVLIMGTMTAATVYTRWSATMQMGSSSGIQPSEQIKKQAEKTGLSVTPTETKDGKQKSVSATDNGITVTAVQTLADQYGGVVIFRIKGLKLEDGQLPWVWFDFLIDGQPLGEIGETTPGFNMGLSGDFYEGITQDAQGNLVYIKNGQPVAADESGSFVYDFQLSDGSLEYRVRFQWDGNPLLGKVVTFRFTGFGIQGATKYDEAVMTVPGDWELTWTLEGSAGEAKTWIPNAPIGSLPITLSQVEIGQYSMKLIYRIDEQAYAKYADFDDFQFKNAWSPYPAGVRWKDGTEMFVNGGGTQYWDAENHRFTVIIGALDTVLDPEQIVGMSFYFGTEREKCDIPFE